MKPPRLADLIREPKSEAGPYPPAPPTAPAAPPEAPGAATRPATTEAPGAVVPAGAPAAVALSAPEMEAHRAYDLSEQWLAELFQQARSGDFDGTDVFDNVRAILERPSLLEALYAETFRRRALDSFLPRNALNLCIYGLRLGRALDYEQPALVDLGVAALLSKIGLARVPQELVMKQGQLSRREFVTLQEYPKIGRDMCLTKGAAFERVARIVYQVNERIDGSGYPQRLHEGEIVEAALIIGLVSVFDALVQPRPYRERMMPFGALKELLERERAHFPRRLLRAFVASFSAFPPFTYVRLNSKAVARVLESEPGHPLRPVVAVVLDASGRRPSSTQALRLREAPLLYITGPATEEEISA